jgi:adenosylcobinamide kinase/adenosylcobinamide-phosphate guanylyltransferase
MTERENVMSITLITGGARSGKSSYAEKISAAYDKPVVYIACGKVTDAEMEDRVKKHQARRPEDWPTVERYQDFSKLSEEQVFKDHDIFLLDCVTTMATNLMFEVDVDYDTCSMDEMNRIEDDIKKQFEELLEVMQKDNKTLILVSNEVGQGVVPSYRLGRFFRDLAGRINQYLAAEADEVIWMVSGIPVYIKEAK